MNLTVLGRRGPFAVGGESTSSYLLQSPNKKAVMLDAGSGSVAKLLNKISLSELGFLVLTHLHFDHASDIGVLSYAVDFLRVRAGGEKLNVYIPFDNSPLENVIKNVKEFNVIRIAENEVYSDSGYKFEFFRMNHPVKTYGVKICDGEKTFAYSGDTNVCDNIPKLLKNADFAVLDGMILGGENKNAPHLSAVKACEYLKGNGVKGLISHLKYDVGETAYEKEIENYKTIAKIAKDGETIEF